jgi:hypothetical protein
MNLKLTFATILCLLLSYSLFAQRIMNSTVHVQTCYHEKECFSVSESGVLFYDEASHNLYLKLDFKKFKIGNDSLDEWLLDLEDSYLYFKAQVMPEQFPSLSNHNARQFKINGDIKLNGIHHNKKCEMAVYEISEQSMLFVNNDNKYFDHLRIILALNIVPKEHKIDKKSHHHKKTIYVQISQGYINLIKPGMENIVREFEP